MSEPVSAGPLVAVGESSSRGPERLAVAIIAALVLAFFGHVLRFPFIYDDHWTIVDNPVVSQGSGLGQLLSGQLVREGVPDAGRPVMLASVILDARLWGLSPMAFHAQNLFWHALASILVLLGLRHLTQSLPAALFAAAIFAVHPLTVEPVAAVNYREDLLSTSFLLLGLFAVGASRRADGRGAVVVQKVLAFGCFVTAAGAKESAYVAPLLLLLLDLFLPRAESRADTARGLPPGKSARERIVDVGLAALATGLVMLWRRFALGAWGEVSQSAASNPDSLLFRVVESGHGFVAGLFQSIAPRGLSPEYDPVAIDGWGLFVGLAALVAIAGLVALVVYLRPRAPLAALGLAWALVAFLPTSGLVALTNERADRYMYLGLPGLILVVVVGLSRLSVRLSERLRRGRPPVTVAGMPLTWMLAGLMVTGLGLVSRQQSLLWADEERLWAYAVKHAPNSPRSWAGWGSLLLERRQTLEAQLAATAGLTRFNGDPRLRELLGLTYLHQGSIATACDVLKQAADVGPAADRAQRASNLGYCYMRLLRFEDALPQFEKARRLAPWFDRGWTNAIETLKRMGRTKEAEALQAEFDARGA